MHKKKKLREQRRDELIERLVRTNTKVTTMKDALLLTGGPLADEDIRFKSKTKPSKK